VFILIIGKDSLIILQFVDSRACGHGVCRSCSYGRINENRVCDICFQKERFPFFEQRKKDKLDEKEFMILESKRKLILKKEEYTKAQSSNKAYNQHVIFKILFIIIYSEDLKK